MSDDWVDITPSHGEYIAQRWSASEGFPVGEPANLGLIQGSDPDKVAAFARETFGVAEVTMPMPNDECETWRVHCSAHPVRSPRKHTVFRPCPRHTSSYAAMSRYRRAEVMGEGGLAGSPCTDGKYRCSMLPGTDLCDPSWVAEHPVYTVGDPL